MNTDEINCKYPEQALIQVIGLDMWGGDYAERKVENIQQAALVAAEWVTDHTKCATFFEENSIVYLKFSRECQPNRSKAHKKCTTFFKGTLIK